MKTKINNKPEKFPCLMTNKYGAVFLMSSPREGILVDSNGNVGARKTSIAVTDMRLFNGSVTMSNG